MPHSHRRSSNELDFAYATTTFAVVGANFGLIAGPVGVALGTMVGACVGLMSTYVSYKENLEEKYTINENSPT